MTVIRAVRLRRPGNVFIKFRLSESLLPSESLQNKAPTFKEEEEKKKFLNPTESSDIIKKNYSYNTEIAQGLINEG